MKGHSIAFAKKLLAGSAVGLGFLAVPLVAEGVVSLSFDSSGQAYAAGHEGQGGQGASAGQRGGEGVDRGHRGGAGEAAGQSILEDRIFRGGGKRVIIILEDDDSDRPEWAQGNRDLNPHAQGGGRPPGSGVKKGDIYGDLYVILRDDNGEPDLDEYGHVQPILTDGTVIQLTPEGDIPPGYEDLVVEVELGRLSVGRSPDKVTDHALDEALSKIDAATIIAIDEAGRLVLDGATIDSPLENLALYVYVVTGGTIDGLPEGFDVAALLGAASDKTGEITVDVLVYENTILGVNTVDVASGTIDYYDFSTYDYDRAATFDGVMVSYLDDPEGDGTYVLVTEPVMDAVFSGEDWSDPTAGGGADDFTQSADDSRAVIEFLHSALTPEVAAAN